MLFCSKNVLKYSRNISRPFLFTLAAAFQSRSIDGRGTCRPTKSGLPALAGRYASARHTVGQSSVVSRFGGRWTIARFPIGPSSLLEGISLRDIRLYTGSRKPRPRSALRLRRRLSALAGLVKVNISSPNHIQKKKRTKKNCSLFAYLYTGNVGEAVFTVFYIFP